MMVVRPRIHPRCGRNEQLDGFVMQRVHIRKLSRIVNNTSADKCHDHRDIFDGIYWYSQ